MKKKLDHAHCFYHNMCTVCGKKRSSSDYLRRQAVNRTKNLENYINNTANNLMMAERIKENRKNWDF